jgi:hypothetical protein
VEALTRGLVNKLLHQPVQAIKAAASEGNAAAVDAIRGAFGASGQSRTENEAFDDTAEGLFDDTAIAAAFHKDRDPRDPNR